MSTTHFGFKTVDASEKAARVRGVFDAVAPRYDVMNDVMSFGLHRLWKEALINQLRPRAGIKLLDVAGGTGDVAERALRRAPEMDITLCDINQNMLAEGRSSAIDRNRLRGIEWVCGDAQTLPFPDQHFDAYTIAFGIRNVTDITAALRDARRVLKTGGHFLCLEFSKVQPELLAKLYDWYSFQIIPKAGKIIAGDSAPYQYLVESIRKFPSQEEFAAMLRDAGFSNVSHQNLTGGTVAIHSGWRI